MTTATKTAAAPEAAATAKQKQRSPNYPAVSLKTAIELARKLYDSAKRTYVSEQVAATAMGYKSLNGTTRGHISALKKYGLVEDEGPGLQVSNLAMQILMHPEGSPDRQTAINVAAFIPEIFKEVYNTHREAADSVLRPYLILNKQFSEAGADQFIQAFRDTMALVRGEDSGYDGGMATETQTPPAFTGGGTPGASIQSMQGNRPNQPRLYSWPLDDDTTAEVRIIGSQVSRDHLDALIEYLEVAKKRLSERKRDEALGSTHAGKP